MQIFVLSFGRFATPNGATAHVVDELVMLGIEALFVALEIQRDFIPLRLAVSAKKITLAVLFVLGVLCALGIASVVGGVVDLLRYSFIEAATIALDVIDEFMNTDALGFQQTPHGVYGRDDLAITVRGQSAHDVAEQRAVLLITASNDVRR